MQLTLESKYKSLNPFSIELPNLTILTGVNGAGKTQILTAIIERQIKLTENGVELNPKKYVTHSTLAPNESAIVTRLSISEGIENLWNNFNTYLSRYKNNPSRKLNQDIQDSRKVKVIEKIAIESGKTLTELTNEDFHYFYPIEDGLSHNDIFYQNFSNLFKKYNDKFVNNKFLKFMNEIEGHKELNFFSNDEFLELFGEQPWDFVNKILLEAKLDYYITHL